MNSKNEASDQDWSGTPMKAATEELNSLEFNLVQLLRAYEVRERERIQALLGRVGQLEASQINVKAPDMRDMLTLLRRLELRPDKGRRKDLKKVETILDELEELTKHW